MGFKENIKRLREEAGWTQVKAAAEANVPLRTLQNWEGGTREPRLDALKSLAAAYGVSADVLLADSQPAKPARSPKPRSKGKPKKK
jgi:transcriptional regulator with XRE-family HTH domain